MVNLVNIIKKIIINACVLLSILISFIPLRAYSQKNYSFYAKTYASSSAIINNITSSFYLHIVTSFQREYEFENSVFRSENYPSTIIKPYSRISSQDKTFLVDSAITSFKCENLNADSVLIRVDSLSFELVSTNLNVLHFQGFFITNGIIEKLIIRRSNIKTLIFENIVLLKNINFPSYDFGDMVYEGSKLDTLKLIKTEVRTPLLFNNIPYPTYIILDNINFDSNNYIDLTEFKNLTKNAICKLRIENINADISRLKLNYENFELDFADSPSWKREGLYKNLLENQLKQGYIYGFQKLDKEFKQFEYVKDNTQLGKLKNWVDREWWDYGYNKFKVVTNSFKIFLFVLLINLLLYSQLLHLYIPDKFRKAEERLVDKFGNLNSFMKKVKFYLYRTPSIVIYSAYIFWGVKLDIKEIEIKRPLIFAIFIIEYILGLVCLAYIANYIISK